MFLIDKKEQLIFVCFHGMLPASIKTWLQSIPHLVAAKHLTKLQRKTHQVLAFYRDPVARLCDSLKELQYDPEGREFLNKNNLNSSTEILRFLRSNQEEAKQYGDWFKPQEDLIRRLGSVSALWFGENEVEHFLLELKSKGYSISTHQSAILPELDVFRETALALYPAENSKPQSSRMLRAAGNISAYFINMAKDADRRARVEKQAKNLGIRLHRIEAITPDTIRPITDVEADKLPRNAQIHRALLTSHLVTLRTYLEKSSAEFALVLEDDVCLDAMVDWTFSLRELIYQLPDSCGLLQLTVIWPITGMTKIPGAPEGHMTVNLAGDTSLSFRRNVPNVDWCTGAYLIRRQHAQAIVDYFWHNNRFELSRYPGQKVADVTLYDHLTLKSPYKTYTLPILYCEPMPSSFDREQGQQMMHHVSREATRQNLAKKPSLASMFAQKIDETEHPFVSIITPTFNRRNCLPLLEDRILQQTYPRCRMEWVVVDDSTDGQPDWTPKPNTGLNVLYEVLPEKMPLGQKRNYTSSKAKGSILVHMDDDDYYFPDRVASVVHALVSQPQCTVAGSTILPIYFTDLDELYIAGPYGQNHTTAGAMAYRRVYLESQKFDPGAIKGEEPSFLSNYTIPLVQVDPWKTMICFSHDKNTFDKRAMIGTSSLRKSTDPISKFIPQEILQQYLDVHKPKLADLPDELPLVSIVMTTLNAEEVIAQVVTSLQNQTYTNWHLTIMDLGSQDGTKQRLLDSHRINWVDCSGLSAAEARNQGIQATQGDFILTLDPNDWLEPVFIEQAVRSLIGNKDKHIVYTGYVSHDENMIHVKPGHFELVSMEKQNQLTLNALFRRSVFDGVGGYRSNLVWGGEDWDFWVAAAARGFKATKIDAPLLHRRKKPDQLREKETRARVILNNAPFFSPDLLSDAQKIWATVSEEARQIRPSAFTF